VSAISARGAAFSRKVRKFNAQSGTTRFKEPQRSDDCVSRRAFRPFLFRARASIMTTMAFAIADLVD
jgi:hypothetical protein